MDNMTAEEIFQSSNKTLADKLRTLVLKSVDKANEMVSEAERPEDIYTAIKIAEVAGKITGIVREKQQINMQINQITGFTFIEVNKENLVQEKEVNNDILEHKPMLS